jgi:hypothetical protein
MAHIKITFSIIFFRQGGSSYLPQMGQKWVKSTFWGILKFCRRPRENDVWHENYKWHHMALDFSTG